MALVTAIALASAQLEHLDLLVADLRKNSCLDLCTIDKRVANLYGLPFANRQHLVQRDFLPNVSRYLFYLEFLASGYAILLAAGFYDRMHLGDFLEKVDKLRR